MLLFHKLFTYVSPTTVQSVILCSKSAVHQICRVPTPLRDKFSDVYGKASGRKKKETHSLLPINFEKYIWFNFRNLLIFNVSDFILFIFFLNVSQDKGRFYRVVGNNEITLNFHKLFFCLFFV